MRSIPMFFVAASLFAAANIPPSPELLQIRTVYILPMRLGFDQYLANRLAQSGLLRVVTDPKKADAVLTDHIGASFEERLDELIPPPKPPSPAPAEAAPVIGKSASDASNPPSEDAEPVAKPPAKKAKMAITDASSSQSSPPPRGSFSTGRGNVFLVDSRNRSVLWSTYEQLESAQPASLTHIAEYVVKDLKHALQPPKAKGN
jgi:hypothetical protein